MSFQSSINSAVGASMGAASGLTTNPLQAQLKQANTALAQTQGQLERSEIARKRASTRAKNLNKVKKELTNKLNGGVSNAE